MRHLDTDTLAGLLSTVVRPALLVACDFSGGWVRVWSGIGDLVVGDDTFAGVGTFGTISTVEEGVDVASRGLALSLSGVPSGLVAGVLGDDYRGRPCTVWLGCFNEARSALLGDPMVVFRGQMDTCEISDDGTLAAISLQVENRLSLLRRARTMRLTHEQQIVRFPGDRGLEYMSKLAERPIYWGLPSPSGGISIDYDGGNVNPWRPRLNEN
jgi:hypothetical protein